MKTINSTRIDSLELDAVMKNGRGFAPTYLSLLLCIAILIRPAISLTATVLWTGSYLTYIIIRTKATSIYHADPRRYAAGRILLYKRFVMGSATAHGLLLGSLAFIALPSVSITTALMLTAIVVLVCAAGTVYVAALFAPLFALISLTIIPFAIGWYLGASSMRELVASMLCGAWLLNVYMAWNHNRLLSENWRALAANESLSAELAAKNRELEQLGSSRNRLFAIASHDLRQPVHALGLTIAQLNEFDHPAALRRHFDRLQESSFIVSEMLQELMDLSNLERNEYSLNVGPLRLASLLRQVKLSQELIAKRKDLMFTVDVDTPLVVRSDVNLLRRILFNLVSNAVKYTAYGSVKVEAFERGQAVCLRVTDTGIGIPQHQIDDIFRDYVRLEGASKTAQGIGLGLAITRRAVDLLGHRLSVQSEVGTGSVFEITVEKSDESELPLVQRAWPDPDAEAASGGLVILIEDDPYGLTLLEELVKRWGYTVLAGATGDEILSRVPEGIQPALIISDLQLGTRETGFEAIGALRARFGARVVPAILLTGDVRPAVRTRALRENITVAHKPLSPMVLHHEITTKIG